MTGKVRGTIVRREIRVAVLVISWMALTSTLLSANRPEVTINCRAMEATASRQFHVRLVIFHYRDPADRARLGELLRQYDGRAVEFRSQDGIWHAATLLRLGTCFGRGLLVYSAPAAELAARQTFLLRFSGGAAK